MYDWFSDHLGGLFKINAICSAYRQLFHALFSMIFVRTYARLDQEAGKFYAIIEVYTYGKIIFSH